MEHQLEILMNDSKAVLMVEMTVDQWAVLKVEMKVYQ